MVCMSSSSQKISNREARMHSVHGAVGKGPRDELITDPFQQEVNRYHGCEQVIERFQLFLSHLLDLFCVLHATHSSVLYLSCDSPKPLSRHRPELANSSQFLKVTPTNRNQFTKSC